MDVLDKFIYCDLVFHRNEGGRGPKIHIYIDESIWQFTRYAKQRVKGLSLFFKTALKYNFFIPSLNPFLSQKFPQKAAYSSSERRASDAQTCRRTSRIQPDECRSFYTHAGNQSCRKSGSCEREEAGKRSPLTTLMDVLRHRVNGLHVHTYRRALKSCPEVCNGLDPLIIPGTALSSRSAQADGTTAAGT